MYDARQHSTASKDQYCDQVALYGDRLPQNKAPTYKYLQRRMRSCVVVELLLLVGLRSPPLDPET